MLNYKTLFMDNVSKFYRNEVKGLTPRKLDSPLQYRYNLELDDQRNSVEEHEKPRPGGKYI